MDSRILQQQMRVVRSALTFNTVSVVRQPNQFDEHGSLLSLPRLYEEKNAPYKRRIQDAAVHLANSAYQGLVYGITRELGLSLFNAIDINPKVDTNGDFLAPDPYIWFNGVWLALYSDYGRDSLDWAVDRFQKGGNYEHLGRLVDMINTTSFFEASLRPNVDPYTRSMSILNQSNHQSVSMEFVPQSTKFRLDNRYLVNNTAFFSNRTTFKTEMSSASAVSSRGQYHINYSKGIVTVYTIPNPREYIRYRYVEYPFTVVASPIILHDINQDVFREKMFEQVLQLDGTYEHGLPTELGVDIINELMSVSPMYWGI